MIKNLGKRLKRRKFHRKLEVSKAGFWFLVLTIAIGVVALMTGNNVIYLIESFLLASLILSGVVSEKAISTIQVRFHSSQARAEERSSDWLEITNRSRQTFYGLEFGEWRDGKESRLASVTMIRPGETIKVRSDQIFKNRGEHRWDGHSISTSGPFGFAKKTRVIWESGSRIVWPSRPTRSQLRTSEGQRDSQRSVSGTEIADGEVRPYQLGDDAKMIVAKLSAKGLGYFVRNLQKPRSDEIHTLDLRGITRAQLESRIRSAARAIEESDDPGIRIVDDQTKRSVRGLRPSMNAISVIEIEEAA